jgi:putative inorganic carbon (hco3(-)) transporter
MVVASALITARLTMVSVQLGCSIALVVLVVGLYFANRSAGLGAMWLVWLVAPLLRRVFFLSDPIEVSDPLALAPFVVTAAIVVLEYTRTDLDRKSRRVLVLIGAGYAVGLPVGLLFSPPAAAFALFAYLTAAGCFVIGYSEGAQGRRLVLPTVLMLATPLLAAYAFGQYYLELPEWDAVWFETAEINTTGSPDGERVRVWSALNSPGTFALILGIASVTFIASRRFSLPRLAGVLMILGALALTYVRSAWLALAVAILVIAVVSRGAAAKQLIPVILVLAVLGPVALGGSAGAAVSERANSFGALGSDESAGERVATPVRLLPDAVARPLGRGIGQAGEATRLLDSGGFRYTDNGYLSLLLQVGPFGFVLVMAAVAMAFRSAWRNVWRRPDDTNALVLALLAFFVVTMLAGDALYGVGGMIFWYTTGLAMRRGRADSPRIP